ncbi:MAG: hypothetical protein A2Y92_02645 [Chloroflexi bacterium RBG_13_57_8]|nr:MAG: hypothetical protein A2Y92_02645 [Chloroflexi bacterium RBG_13_57_8]
MYSRILWIIPIVVVLLAGCGGPSDQLNPAIGEKFMLSIGQSASIKGENLVVRFVEVVGDSRCPQDVTCIWAGEATSLIEITFSGNTYQKALTQPGLTEPPQTDFQNYLIMFDLQPYPRANVTTEKKDYRLQLEFQKKSG